jgi:transcriptional regulator with XRE-family HTH domain
MKGQVIHLFSYTGSRKNEDENQEKSRQRIPDSVNINQGGDSMARTFESDLQQNLRDPEFAKRFGSAQAKSSFALTLARARAKLGLTQKELANKAGVSQAYIAKLEGGEANPTLERIGSLLAVLELSLTTDTSTLSPYPDTLAWVTDWASDNLLISQSMVPFLQFVPDAREKKEVLTL